MDIRTLPSYKQLQALRYHTCFVAIRLTPPKEEELTAIKRREAIFIRQRDAEMAEVQRMEAEAKRKSSEK